VHSPFKVITRNHSHTIKTDRSKVVATRSTTVDDPKLFEWDLKVTNVGVCV